MGDTRGIQSISIHKINLLVSIGIGQSMINQSPHNNRSSIAVDWHSNLEQTLRALFVRSVTILRRPWGKVGKTIWPSLLNAKNIPCCMRTRITTCPSLSFRVIVSMQEVQEEVLLVIKGNHLYLFEVNVGEVFTASKKS